MSLAALPWYAPSILSPALKASVLGLSPRRMWRNPVLLVTQVGAVWCTVAALAGSPGAAAIAAWLWLTLWFAALGEALAEGRGRAHAEALRRSRSTVTARRLAEARRDSQAISVDGGTLQPGDFVLVEAGGIIPADGEAVVGVAAVDESAITGESAPVIREAGGDRNAVTGGTKVLSDWLIVRVTQAPGAGFIDQLIALVEGASRQKTPNEVALTILLAGMSITLVLACVTLVPFSAFAAGQAGQGAAISTVTVVALVVCLIPTTIGGLVAAIGIAGIDRLHRANVLARSGRAVEAAGDVEVLLLDKTGTITLGNRCARKFLPAPGVTDVELAEAAQLASLADETPEGRSIVVLAKEQFGLRGRELGDGVVAVPFTARSRMSGIDQAGVSLRKGAVDSVVAWVATQGGTVSPALVAQARQAAAEGATPLLVARAGAGVAAALGVIVLADVVKGGIRERFAELRRMGIRTVMITGDNPATAAAIAAEAGVDEFRAEVTPERKLAIVREFQAGGRLVAMTGDGTNDAPALAQADVAVAMQSGTQAAKEAGNLVDLDSNPTKLIDVVRIGKQLLMTRGALTTFSLANDVAKYAAILPAALAPIYPGLSALDLMHLHSPASAILSAIIFNALVIPALIPLALRGVAWVPLPAGEVLARNLWIYGVGGVVSPFVGIWLIDRFLTLTGIV